MKSYHVPTSQPLNHAVFRDAKVVFIWFLSALIGSQVGTIIMAWFYRRSDLQIGWQGTQSIVFGMFIEGIGILFFVALISIMQRLALRFFTAESLGSWRNELLLILLLSTVAAS